MWSCKRIGPLAWQTAPGRVSFCQPTAWSGSVVCAEAIAAVPTRADNAAALAKPPIQFLCLLVTTRSNMGSGTVSLCRRSRWRSQPAHIILARFSASPLRTAVRPSEGAQSMCLRARGAICAGAVPSANLSSARPTSGRKSALPGIPRSEFRRSSVSFVECAPQSQNWIDSRKRLSWPGSQPMPDRIRGPRIRDRRGRGHLLGTLPRMPHQQSDS
jgi:hypothetical protein